MADSLIDFLEEFDELSREASQAPYGLFVARLKHLLSFLDNEDDNVRAHVNFLKNRIPWDELKATYLVDRGGMGGEMIKLPDDRLDALSLYVNIFMRMADDSLPVDRTVLTYFRGRSRNMDGAHSNMIDEIFNPYVTSLRRYIQKNYDDDPPELDSVSAPASDRTVTINHNSAEYVDSEREIENLIQLLRVTNDFDSPESKAQQIAELEAGKIIIAAPTARTSLIDRIFRYCLELLAKKFADVAIGAAAKRLLALIGQLTGLW